MNENELVNHENHLLSGGVLRKETRGGEKVIISTRERKEEKLTDLFKQTLKVMFHIITSL